MWTFKQNYCLYLNIPQKLLLICGFSTKSIVYMWIFHTKLLIICGYSKNYCLYVVIPQIYIELNTLLYTELKLSYTVY